MCGIFGYVGKREASSILLGGLKKLEYRGYDSAGIATVCGDVIEVKKDIGKIDEVDSKVGFCDMLGTAGIAHSRWSTHGAVSKENAHPHLDCTKKIAIVHNGIIENHSALKKKLMEKGHKFNSATDTEVIAHLIEDHFSGDMKAAMLDAIKEIDGSYALGVVSLHEPSVIYAVRNESPLVIGIGDKENFIASDVPALIEHTKRVIYLSNKELARIDGNGAAIYDADGREREAKAETVEWSLEAAEKGGFEHFMLKEIFEQPRVVEDAITGRVVDDEIDLSAELPLDREGIFGIKRIIIIACGTSWHAGLVGEFMIEELAKIPVEVEYASEFRYRDPIIEEGTLVIPISQSGETADTLAAMREAKGKGAKIISIVNVLGSSIARDSDGVLYTRAGPEIGVASTKAFTSQLIVLYLLTVYLGAVRGALPKQQVKNRVRDLRKLPLQMEAVLDDNDPVRKQAEKFLLRRNALYLGRGINFPIALEGALKLKEISYIHAEGYPAAEMKHGPIALIDRDMPVVVIATKDDRTYQKVLSNIEEVKSRGGEVIAIVSKGDHDISKLADHCLRVPENSYILTPLLAVIPAQLFAYHVARLRCFDVDKPRNLAKSVTVE